ncbi:MAG: hypothetical protein ACXAAH_02830 [Promethearchaeota archaeon]
MWHVMVAHFMKKFPEITEKLKRLIEDWRISMEAKNFKKIRIIIMN